MTMKALDGTACSEESVDCQSKSVEPLQRRHVPPLHLTRPWVERSGRWCRTTEVEVEKPSSLPNSRCASSRASTAPSFCGSFVGSMTSRSSSSLPKEAPGEPHAEWWSLDMVAKGTPRQVALEELRRYIEEFQAMPKDDFWHRKSRKPVLSVVVCCGPDGQLEYFRGMNTEVSLPAGSLCAERAAIARAASDFRQASEIQAIATADPSEQIVPLWPCEVCQSWLAKLRPQSPTISVLAVVSNACDRFAVKVNGELQRPPLLSVSSPLRGKDITWQDRVILADGAVEWPWETHDLVYVDGAWTFFHAAQQNILRQARSRGSHLLVGVHSDEVLQSQFNSPALENYAVRVGRILQSRHVCSVLADAPWAPTMEMVASLGIKHVVMGSLGKVQDIGLECSGNDNPYRVAHELGILEVITSFDNTTEHLVHTQLKSRSNSKM